MIPVSNDWKETHKQKILPESFVEIAMNIGDDISSKFDSASVSTEAGFSNISEMVHNIRPAAPSYYVTLEENLWILDGTRNLFDSNTSTKHNGYISGSLLSSSQSITLLFKQQIKTVTPGITIVWSNEYDEFPTIFEICARHQDTTIGSKTVTNNSSNVSYVDTTFTEYTSLQIIVYDWNLPNHRVRIDQVYFGLQLVFDKNDLLNYTHEQTGDPFSSELSKNSITFEVDNVRGQWDLLNPTGVTKYLSEKQPLSVRYGMQTDVGVEWIPAGTFYLSEWVVADDGMSIRFSARDVIEFMLTNTYSRSGRKAEVRILRKEREKVLSGACHGV